MSVIPQLYNQGTGLVGSTSESNQIPTNVQNLIVEQTLTVLGESTFEGGVTVNSDVTIGGIVTIDQLDVQDATIENATILNANVTNLDVENATIENGTIVNADITDATIDTADITSATIGTANITDATIDTADVTTATIDTATVTDLTATDITTTDITVTGEIGTASAPFQLPLNNPTSDGQVLKVTGAPTGPYTTSWEDDDVIDDYVSYDPASTELQNNVSGVQTTITDLRASGRVRLGETSIDRIFSSVNRDCPVLFQDTETFPLDDRIKQSTGMTYQPSTETLKLSGRLELLDTIGGFDAALFNAASGTLFIEDQSVQIRTGQPTISSKVSIADVVTFFANTNPTFNDTNMTFPNGVTTGLANRDMLLVVLDFTNPSPNNRRLRQYNDLTYNPVTEVFTAPIITPGQIGNTVYETPGGDFIQMPTGTPSAGDAIRFNGGSGTAANPYTTTWAP